MEAFLEAYKNLNQAQKKAVDTIEGPVMVIAGPGTGKTQVLALRIAHILDKTDTPGNGILCLTFTRAGVSAMRERLSRYIGARAREVVVSTFHSFAINLIEKHFALLDFDAVPKLLTEQDTVILIDELLHARQWAYIRPRGDAAKYFSDLKSLVSLLKRERLTAEYFLAELEREIKLLQADPESISSRGETKGQLKKEVQKKIEGLERTREVISFYEHYELLKKERALMDYDDILEYAVKLVEEFEDVRAELRENYLYILVDEHQDSSGVQNAFLKAVWQEIEKPNIFVVGDDRQLIYGFGGASLSYFEAFKTLFGCAELITLVENYRSTAPILSLADDLLKSSLTSEKLRSNRIGGHKKIGLFEYSYPRDEIIAAGLHFRKMIAKGVSAEECALLVPKNRHIRSAVAVLRDMGMLVRSASSVSLFSLSETDMFKRVLGIIADPFNNTLVAESVFDAVSGIPPLIAHAFLREASTRNLSVETLLTHGDTGGLFDEHDPIRMWGAKLLKWITLAQTVGLEALVHAVGNELLIDMAQGHDQLMRRVEVVRTMLHLVGARTESHPKETLVDFLTYLTRLETYGHTIPVATLLGGQGISVLTLHGSKGLEYENVWIAHMNESVLMSQKRGGFTLPQSIEALVEARDRAVATREVYVAVTRAKMQCTISYAKIASNSTNLELAHIIVDMQEAHFEKKTAEETERELVDLDPKFYVAQMPAIQTDSLKELAAAVRTEYPERKVSVTLLNNFFECPWKWYFRNLLQLPEIKSESQVFGSAVHGAIESILNGTLKPSEKIISAYIFECLIKGGIREESIITSRSQEGTEAVLRWSAHYLPYIAKDHTAERSLSYRDPAFAHLVMYGKIDLTERFSDGSIVVTDFKTGSSKTTGVIEKSDEEGRLSPYLRQLAMYSYLIHGAEKKDVATSKLLFVEEDMKKKNSLYNIYITEEQIDLLKRDIHDYDELLKKGEWINRPCNVQSRDGSECEYCKWAREVYGK